MQIKPADENIRFDSMLVGGIVALIFLDRHHSQKVTYPSLLFDLIGTGKSLVAFTTYNNCGNLEKSSVSILGLILEHTSYRISFVFGKISTSTSPISLELFKYCRTKKNNFVLSFFLQIYPYISA